MSDEEAINLIFAPGFSTAGQVTDLSGRGVGMDIVRNTIERLGGRVSVWASSAHDRPLHLPFTVMMTQVLTVEAAGESSACPWGRRRDRSRRTQRDCARRRRPRHGPSRPHAAGHRPGPGLGKRGPRLRNVRTC